MTTKFEEEAKLVLHLWRTNVKLGALRESLVEDGNQVLELAERLLVENSQLRVRDSNVTAHSLNVMSVNEDLVEKIGRRCGTCKHRGHPNGPHVWKCEKISAAPQSALAYVVGDYGMEASIEVKAEFGCVLWEAK